MRRAHATIDLKDARRIARQVAERFHPEKIILFGSRARSSQGNDSDVDLLVIMESAEPPIHAAARIAASIEHPFPIDIVVMRPGNFKASVARKGVFATAVNREGVVLYEA